MIMSSTGYKFYMQGITKRNEEFIDAEESPKDLEKDFEGLRYIKCEGIENVGEVKNIYTEEYSDSDTLRVFMPTEVYNKATSIKLTLLFVGENRQSVKDSFENYIRNGFHKYWDTARNKSFIFFFDEKISVSEEKWYGSTPYIECTYELKNIKGLTTKKTESEQ